MPGRKHRGAAGPDAFCVLDVGAHKIACFVVTRGADAPVSITGFAHRRSAGVKDGWVADVDAAQAAIRQTVEAAERQAGATVTAAFVCSTLGRAVSHRFSAKVRLQGPATPEHVRCALSGAVAYAERSGRAIVHFDEVRRRVEHAEAAGRRLSADVHAVTTDRTAVTNLLAAVRRARLQVAGLVAASYASAVGCTTREERQTGVACVDIGAEATTAALFRGGLFARSVTLPYGGNHITRDIAAACQTSLAAAHRIKALYGAAIGTSPCRHGFAGHPASATEASEVSHDTKARVTQIAQDWIGRIAAGLDDRVFRGCPAASVVLTGGGAQLPGAADYAGAIVGRPVRVGRPHCAARLPEEASAPPFSALTGALKAALAGRASRPFASPDTRSVPIPETPSPPRGYLWRVQDWLSSGFE